MYSIPTIGTILPARENVNPTISNPGPTANTVLFNLWAQAAAQADAYRRNVQLANQYKWSFTSWLNETYPYQPNPDLAPPNPPAAYVVLVAPAEAAPVDFEPQPSGASITVPFTPDGYDQPPTYSTGPYVAVCSIPAYTKIPPPNDPSKNKIA